MDVNQSNPDLTLWKDLELFKKQHRLKLQFWTILNEVAEGISEEKLSAVHSKHKSFKLSKGNDLLGMPYHVLDIIRDFDEKKGLNFRLLNWFGVGIYFMVLTGNEISSSLSTKFFKGGFNLGDTDSPWDYPGLILEKKVIYTFDNQNFEQEGLQVWIKELEIGGDRLEIINKISTTVNNTISLILSIG